ISTRVPGPWLRMEADLPSRFLTHGLKPISLNIGARAECGMVLRGGRHAGAISTVAGRSTPRITYFGNQITASQPPHSLELMPTAMEWSTRPISLGGEIR